MLQDASLVLMSASPRRKELLSLTGIPFLIASPDVDESCELPPRDAVLELSRRKALAGKAAYAGRVVLAADTLVSINGMALGKPADEADAFRMLRLLAGHWHQVFTGITVIDRQGGLHSGVDATDVLFSPMTDEEIRHYIATGEPMDKAGAYAVQGIAGLWIEELRGSHSNVIGLPLALTRRLLTECGLHAIGLERDFDAKRMG